MITFYTYRVVVAKSVRTVLQGTNRTRRPKRTTSAFAVTKNFGQAYQFITLHRKRYVISLPRQKIWSCVPVP